MTPIALIDGGSETRHFGLRPEERLRRQLAKQGVESVSNLDEVRDPSASVLLIRGDRLFDDRLIKCLVRGDSLRMVLADGEAPALVAPATIARELHEGQSADGSYPAHPDLPNCDPDAMLAGVFHDLRKVQRPFVLPVRESDRVAHENLLYDASYKGVTDMVTKWFWPLPARACVRVFASVGISPNMVTVTGFSLMLVALWAFWEGHYALGLACGWVMTFFDTVDGKLARTTITASPFGHWLDKLTDIIHPPFWYHAWAYSLAVWAPPAWPVDLGQCIGLMWGFYLGGRIVEQTCTGFLVKGGLFVWKPLDSYFRLITARRNTCLLVLTPAWALGRPDLGLWLIVWWTMLTTVFMAGRMLLAMIAKPKGAKLRSWLLDVKQDDPAPSLAVRWFTR
jgi:phosphatidylglycerophosphate synthase